MLFTLRIHRFYFLLGLALSLCALPYSPFALSVGLITLAANWLLEGSWVEKYKRFVNRRALWLFLMIYASIVVGVFYSDNIRYAFKELRLWLPILLVPVILTTSVQLKRSEFRSLLMLFCTSVIVATIISFSIYMQHFSQGSQNVRTISLYISHIRLALMVNIAFFILIYFILQKGFFQIWYIKLVLLVVAIWLIVFLFILQSFTGIAIFGIVLFILCFIWVLSVKDIVIKFSIIIGLLLAVILGLSNLAHAIDRYFTRNEVIFKDLPKQTINGNQFSHDTVIRQYENGNLVWTNVCYTELFNEWNKLSKLPFDGEDKSGQKVRLTLIRYLASKGLSKDSVGMSNLDSLDINLVEQGVASVIYREHKMGVYPRLYQMLWELDSYITRGAISGSSLVQRYIYLKGSLQIIKNNWLFGVGTGDGTDSLKEYYRTSGVSLDSKYWFISHNQYLTVWIFSGIFGMILFFIGLLAPFFYEKKQKFFLCLVFQVVILISMLNEDTFETHIGVSFAALFYSILFFGYDFRQDNME